MGSEGLNVAVSPCHEIRLRPVERWQGIISKEHTFEAIIQRWVEQSRAVSRSAVSRSTCGQRAAPSLASRNFRTLGPRVIPPF